MSPLVHLSDWLNTSPNAAAAAQLDLSILRDLCLARLSTKLGKTINFQPPTWPQKIQLPWDTQSLIQRPLPTKMLTHAKWVMKTKGQFAFRAWNQSWEETLLSHYIHPFLFSLKKRSAQQMLLGRHSARGLPWPILKYLPLVKVICVMWSFFKKIRRIVHIEFARMSQFKYGVVTRKYM